MPKDWELRGCCPLWFDIRNFSALHTCMLQKTLHKITLSFDALMVYSWISFHYYPPTIPICKCYSSTIGIHIFYTLGRMVWFFRVSQGPDWFWVFRPHLKTISMSNLFRGETKGSTFCSVILRPWVWVWPAIAPGFTLWSLVLN